MTNSLVFFCTETVLLCAVNDLIPFRLLGVCVTCSSRSLSDSRYQNWFLLLLSNCFFFVFISSVLTTLLCRILQGQSLTFSFGPSCITLVSFLPSQLSVLVSIFSSAAPPPRTTLFCLLLTLCLVSNCI